MLPVRRPLAIKLVATSLIVLCEAPDDLILATRQALYRKISVKCNILLDLYQIERHLLMPSFNF